MWNLYQATLRKKCPYSELLWSAFSLIRTEYEEILRASPYSAQRLENADQSNSEYGHFWRSTNNADTITTSRRHFYAFSVNFDYNSHIFIVFLLLTVNS